MASVSAGKKVVKVFIGTENADKIVGTGKGDAIFGFGGDDTILGGNGHDDLDGGAGDDTIKGGNGEDTLFGGTGDDILFGGNGDDTFVIDGNLAGLSVDTIMDFDVDRQLRKMNFSDNVELRNVGGLAVRFVQVGDDVEMYVGDALMAVFKGSQGLLDASDVLAAVRVVGDEPASISITVTGPPDGGDSGTVLDGYIANGLVFRDTNANNIWDHEAFVDANGDGRYNDGELYTDSDDDGLFTAEAFTFTDAQGAFAGLGGTGQIVLAPIIGPDGTVFTRDISTGAAFTSTLRAPDGSTVITPLTTLVSALAGLSATPQEIAAAEALLKASLGLPAGVSLLTYDPITVASTATDPAAIAEAIDMQKAAAQVANVLSVINTAFQAAGNGSGSILAASALADQLMNAAGVVSLTDPTFLTDVLTDAVTASNDPLIAEALLRDASAIAHSLASVNEVISAIDPATDPLVALTQIAAAQIVAQVDLGAATSAAIAGGDPVLAAEFAGTALNAALDEAAGEVGVIVPTDPTGQSLGAPGRPSVDDGVRINAAEISDGIVVSVTYDASAGVSVGDTLVLLLGGVEIATYTLASNDIPAGSALVHAFVVSAAALGADGAKVLNAQFTGQAGTSSPASLPLLITVDTAAPDAPANVQAVEGTILTIVEAADGTVITGTVEASSSVTVTFNGAQSLVKVASVNGAQFSVELSAQEIESLGEGYVTYSAVATDAAGNSGAASATGQYFYTRQPIVDNTARLDGPGSYSPNDGDDGFSKVVALADGGFAVLWVADVTGDDDGDTFAVQRYDAAGEKVGAVALLQGLPEEVVDGRDFGSEVATFDLTLLENGGYALTYAMQQYEVGQLVSGIPSPTGALQFTIVGRPVEINVSSAAPGASFSLVGSQNGAALTIPLTVVDGEIAISRDMLDQFTVSDRYLILVNGLTPNQQVQLFVQSTQTLVYDAAGAVDGVAVSGTVAVPGGRIVLSGPAGRVEAFDIESINATSGTPIYLMVVNVALGNQSIDLGAIQAQLGGPQFAQLTTGGIILSGPALAPDANGVIAVPQAVLSQLGGNDAAISLLVQGLGVGSTVNATLLVREGIPQADGVFVQTFDANGVAVSDPGARLDGPGSYSPNDGDDGFSKVVALADGGFAVLWVADVTGDDDGDTFAVQRYDAAGEKVGAVALLQGLPEEVVDGRDFGSEVATFDLTLLENGGYALTYAMQQYEVGQLVSGIPSPTGALQFTIVGRPVEINVSSAAPGASFSLVGSQNGAALTIPLTVVDGEIAISRDMLDQFTVSDRYLILVNGLTPNQQVQLFVQSTQTLVYDAAGAVDGVAVSGTVAVPGGRIVLSGPAGRVEAFDIESINATSGTPIYLMVVNVALGNQSIDLGAIQAQLGGPQFAQLTTGGIILSGPALAPDANGVIAVPQAVLSQLGGNDAAISLLVQGLGVGSTVNATLLVREGIPQADGVFVQTFDANGVAVSDPGARLDGPGSYSPNDGDDGFSKVVALADGGFAVLWVADVTGDDDGDTFAVQRYDAAGEKVGAVALLQGLPEEVVDGRDFGSEVATFDLTLLENGGYALTYAMQQYEVGQLVSGIPSPTGALQFTIVGRPVEINVSSAAPGASFSLVGSQNGAALTIPLTVVDGEIAISRDMLDQFTVSDRYLILVNGLTPNQQVQLFVQSTQTLVYDAAGAVDGVAVSGTVAVPGGRIVLSGPAGRVEAFDIESINATSGTPIYLMVVNVALGNQSIDLGAIQAQLGGPQFAQLTTGGIILSGPALAPDANGVIAVPQAVLSQLGGNDAAISLLVQGLGVGSTVNATLLVREGIPQADGVFVQTFDANGVAVSPDLVLVGSAASNALVGDYGNDTLTATAGANILTGEDGSDIFRFEAGANGLNIITDFMPGIDKLDFTSIDAVAGNGSQDDFIFIGNVEFDGTAGLLRYSVIAQGVRIEGDTNGDMIADFAVVVQNQNQLTLDDLLL